MTYEEDVMKLGPGKCMVCDKDLKSNAAGIPDAMKVLKLELQAYSQQNICFTGPDQWVCNICIRKLMKHAMDSTASFNDVAI